jgi:hypothetical protein
MNSDCASGDWVAWCDRDGIPCWIPSKLRQIANTLHEIEACYSKAQIERTADWLEAARGPFVRTGGRRLRPGEIAIALGQFADTDTWLDFPVHVSAVSDFVAIVTGVPERAAITVPLDSLRRPHRRRPRRAKPNKGGAK